MRTDDLTALLARDVAPVAAANVGRRFGYALAGGLVGALTLVVALLGARPDLLAALIDPMFWVKLGYPALLLASAFPTVCRLARPGVQLGRTAMLAILPVAAIALMALATLVSAAPNSRSALIFGDTWSACIFNVAMLAIPAFVAALAVMRGLAPTRPALAGAFCGLLAGCTGALAYTLHCPEMAAPFLAAWYTTGIAVPVIAGALLGPSILHW